MWIRQDSLDTKTKVGHFFWFFSLAMLLFYFKYPTHESVFLFKIPISLWILIVTCLAFFILKKHLVQFNYPAPVIDISVLSLLFCSLFKFGLLSQTPYFLAGAFIAIGYFIVQPSAKKETSSIVIWISVLSMAIALSLAWVYWPLVLVLTFSNSVFWFTKKQQKTTLFALLCGSVLVYSTKQIWPLPIYYTVDYLSPWDILTQTCIHTEPNNSTTILNTLFNHPQAGIITHSPLLAVAILGYLALFLMQSKAATCSIMIGLISQLLMLSYHTPSWSTRTLIPILAPLCWLLVWPLTQIITLLFEFSITTWIVQILAVLTILHSALALPTLALLPDTLATQSHALSLFFWSEHIFLPHQLSLFWRDQGFVQLLPFLIWIGHLIFRLCQKEMPWRYQFIQSVSVTAFAIAYMALWQWPKKTDSFESQYQLWSCFYQHYKPYTQIYNKLDRLCLSKNKNNPDKYLLCQAIQYENTGDHARALRLYETILQ